MTSQADQAIVDETRLLGLLVQNIARETVQEFGGLPGVAGDVFSHDFMSTWEWASGLLVELAVATPLKPTEGGFVCYFRLEISVDEIANSFCTRPHPGQAIFDKVLSHWLYCQSNVVPTTRSPFLLQRGPLGKAMEEVWSIMEHLANSGYATALKDYRYLWTDKAAGAMTEMPAKAWNEALDAWVDQPEEAPPVSDIEKPEDESTPFLQKLWHELRVAWRNKP
ncbi:hypothetical protein [Sinorhizobium sp. NFACC03]|uniref:hypothetical protein n=1 Tax=Sinorhizobium sp. NFACC03 TaxID=1566295 RepID=UPI000891F58E|nr:hypothetical protein [Sinorhizobium sp. NFACC03]SDA39578.1 hypothetical protein SAMN03159448_00202 [Sinorhizobium sp. NFACC03]